MRKELRVKGDTPDTPRGPTRVVTYSREVGRNAWYPWMVKVSCGHILWFKDRPVSDEVPCRECIHDPREPIERTVMSTEPYSREQKTHCKITLSCGHSMWVMYEPQVGEARFCRDCRNKEARRQGQLRRYAKAKAAKAKSAENNT